MVHHQYSTVIANKPLTVCVGGVLLPQLVEAVANSNIPGVCVSEAAGGGKDGGGKVAKKAEPATTTSDSGGGTLDMSAAPKKNGGFRCVI